MMMVMMVMMTVMMMVVADHSNRTGYEKMIYLVARHPHRTRKEFSPPFLVDLVWHVHQAHPVAYRRDMTR
jgi:hypothetical protein